MMLLEPSSVRLEFAIVKYGRKPKGSWYEKLALHELPESEPLTTGPGAMKRPGLADVPVWGLNGGSSCASTCDVSWRAPSSRFTLRNMSMSNMSPMPRSSNVDQRSALAGVPVA